MSGTAHDDDMLGRLVGEADLVRDVFEQLPVILLATAGPDHQMVAMNAACRAFTGRSDVIGIALGEVFAEIAGPQLDEMLDRVYASGQQETERGWRAQADFGRGGPEEMHADFTVAPQRGPDGAVKGLLVIASGVTGRVLERPTAQPRAADEEHRYQDAARGAVGVVAELQEALLPAALPVLPRARIAAHYLVAEDEQAAGGDWFDAIPLIGGSVALIVGDVVGHGVAASAAMGQLRAVAAELFATEHDLGRVLERADAFAARTPALQAATLALAVLDPADGTLRYSTCGHPPPLIIGTDGATRFLEGTGTGPLGTGSSPVVGTDMLGPDELVLLYSDGLIERPTRTISEGLAELAKVAADAATNRTLPAAAASTAAERVCRLTVDLLARTGYADDVTTLAAQRLADPVPMLHLELPGERPSLTIARDAFSEWLSRIDATADDREALHLAMVEIFTNAIEHAYPARPRGNVELDADLDDAGNVNCRITDHGTWRPPDPAEADGGHGLMVAGQVVDTMLVSHPPQSAQRSDASPGAQGTVVALRYRLRRPATLASGHASAIAANYLPESAFSVDTSVDNGNARAQVRGPVDITTAGQLARRLLSASRGGTLSLIVDLTRLTQLASAGVRALFRIRELLAVHHQDLTLITKAGSSAHMVLDLVHLPHTVEHDQALGGAAP